MTFCDTYCRLPMSMQHCRSQPKQPRSLFTCCISETTWLENCISKHFSCSTTAHHRSPYRYSNCFMVLLNQRTYYEPRQTRGTMSTFDSGHSLDSNPLQLSTIRFEVPRTFMETLSHGNSQVESSKDNHKKERQNSMEMEVDIGSLDIKWRR